MFLFSLFEWTISLWMMLQCYKGLQTNPLALKTLIHYQHRWFHFRAHPFSYLYLTLMLVFAIFVSLVMGLEAISLSSKYWYVCVCFSYLLLKTLRCEMLLLTAWSWGDSGHHLNQFILHHPNHRPQKYSSYFQAHVFHFHPRVRIHLLRVFSG